ncbi:MAG: signal peptidase I [Candidatus Bathyarchaeia archaeon]
MALQTLKRLWKNEYFQTAITIILILIVVFGFYYGAQAALGTEYPALAVASGSMLPTLNIGDLIIVQKVDPSQIKADPKGLTGDILVYKRGNELIVHRAVSIRPGENGVYLITTRGDNAFTNDPEWSSTQLVGKVMARIPAVGNLPLFLHSERNMYILFLIIIVILVVLMLPFGSKEEKVSQKDEKPAEEKKLLSKISFSLLFYLILNIILFGLIIFSLWSSLSIWQPGATPQKATIYGMFSDLQFHKRYSTGEAYLHLGFLTYQINYEVNNGLRFGVPTFSWFQFFLIIMAAYNLWKLYNHLKRFKIKKTEGEANV